MTRTHAAVSLLFKQPSRRSQLQPCKQLIVVRKRNSGPDTSCGYCLQPPCEESEQKKGPQSIIHRWTVDLKKKKNLDSSPADLFLLFSVSHPLPVSHGKWTSGLCSFSLRNITRASRVHFSTSPRYTLQVSLLVQGIPLWHYFANLRQVSLTLDTHSASPHFSCCGQFQDILAKSLRKFGASCGFPTLLAETYNSYFRNPENRSQTHLLLWLTIETRGTLLLPVLPKLLLVPRRPFSKNTLLLHPKTSCEDPRRLYGGPRKQLAGTLRVHKTGWRLSKRNYAKKEKLLFSVPRERLCGVWQPRFPRPARRSEGRTRGRNKLMYTRVSEKCFPLVREWHA